MSRPIRFYSDYTFGEGPAFRRTAVFNPEAASPVGAAFLSLVTPVERAEHVAFRDVSGTFLTEARGDGKTRVAQTAESADPSRLPRDIRVFGRDGTLVRLDDCVWRWEEAANVFLHRGDLHIAWMDGRPADVGTDGEWRGVSMSVSCDEGSEIAAVGEPFVAKAREERRRDPARRRLRGATRDPERFVVERLRLAVGARRWSGCVAYA
jgi:hypothetical protein